MGSLPFLSVEVLEKRYEDMKTVVLTNVNLSVTEGEFVAIMGPSGSGKSTFMNILGCLDVPSAGRYCLAGEDIAQLDGNTLARRRNQLIGFVFQGFNLLRRISVLDNIALPLLYANKSKTEGRDRAKVLLREVGLEGFAHYLPNQLSGGQQQRVAIARALANHPRLILADEPTGNLDTQTGHEIMELFTRLNRAEGITIMLVSHEAEIAGYARRLVRFRDGRIVEDAPLVVSRRTIGS